MATPEQLHAVLSIGNSRPGDLGAIENGRLVRRLQSPVPRTAGSFFTISTRSGEPIGDAIRKLNRFYVTDVIAEILSCR